MQGKWNGLFEALTGLVLSTSSALLALATWAFANFHPFRLNDPTLMRIMGLHFVSCWLSLRTRGNLAEKLASMARSPLRVGNASYLDHCSGRRINISRFNRHSLKTALSETTASRIAPRDECRKPIGLLEAQEICTDCQLSLRQRY